MLGIKDSVADFLIHNKKELLEEWSQHIIVSQQDPLQEKIPLNGLSMFKLFINMMRDPKEEHMNDIKQLAFTIAAERVEANVNIGDFIYNVCIGRTLVFNKIVALNVYNPEIQKHIKILNDCFDHFLHHSASHYTELQNSVIINQNQVINQTHQDRLTLLGQMTSSFVHEVRNPLTSIKGFVQLLKSEYPDLKYLDIIGNEVDQLNFRISQFLMLSKKESVEKEKKVFLFKNLFDEVIDFLYPSIVDSNVLIRHNVDPDVRLFGFSDEIRQVLLNIILNALDALSGVNQPVLTINALQNDNQQFIIQLSNNGAEIPKAQINVIFEPFYTSKKVGTGLGLFVCKEIISKHFGTLSCTSSESVTTFTITLPVHQ
ncbi:histidine kinase N-terminal domain-containing protein [Peribacillus alkalitolerans]|uniref:histidine kinase N-terminal domain-containing protein n=1 Tax=Peribacillus alkalitolerans TaxID=1550385 RepID=UPI0013D4065B|nr:histidine kinase N-terminal domain-containing protein [Peribacillus alkalitolerans]